MRRRIQKVFVAVGSKFYNIIEAQRRQLQRKIGLKQISYPAFTEMLARSGKLKIPKLNINLFKNVKRKKG